MDVLHTKDTCGMLKTEVQVAGASEVLHLGCHPCKPGKWPLRAPASYFSIMRHPVSFATVSGAIFYPFDWTKSTWVFYVSLECLECGSKEFLALSVVRVLFQRSNMNCQAQPNKYKPQAIAHAMLGWQDDWQDCFLRPRTRQCGVRTQNIWLQVPYSTVDSPSQGFLSHPVTCPSPVISSGVNL